MSDRAIAEQVEIQTRYQGYIDRYTTTQIRANRKIAFAAVQQNGRVLEIISDQLKANRKIVLAVLRQNGEALVYVHYTLYGNKAYNILP